MGRIKTKWMKTVASRLLEAHPGKFTKDFDNNKDVLNEINVFDEKRARNKIAGALVKKMRKTTL
jgi:small subunit ribosomal protein S17e